MIKIARLYYLDNLTQSEISNRLKISKFQINRIIKRAHEMNIVKIIINDQNSSISEIECNIENAFNLRNAIVVENNGLSDIELKNKIGIAASNYLVNIIKEGDIIGSTWATTINEVVNNLPDNLFIKNLKVVQITGGNHRLHYNLNCHDIILRLAYKLNAEAHLLFAPVIVGSKDIRSLFLKEKSITETFDYFNKINIALVGIGALNNKVSSTLFTTGQLSEKDRKTLIKRKVVGDVLSHFFDINGNICDINIAERLIVMSREDLIKVPYSIAVAAGAEKVEAILGALRGKFINILVTDNITANKLINIA